MTSERQPQKGGGQPIAMVATEEYRTDSMETSPLLGAGAGQDDTSNEAPRKDSWAGARDFEHLPAWRRPSVYWLIGPYFLFTLAFGGVIVPKLNLILDLVCRNYLADRTLIDPTFTFTPIILGADNPQCHIPGVQRSVATFTLVTSVLTGVLSALTAPKLGSLSDRYGRTRLLVIASCGGVVNELITILAARFPETVDYHWLILGSFFDGITGSFTAGNVLGSSYASDCSPPSKRGVYMGYLHACLFTGLAFGPLLAGYFVRFTGSLLSIFYVTLGCHICFILIIFFITPESLSKKRQILAREKYQTEQDALAEIIRNGAPSAVARIIGPGAADMMKYHMGDWLTALLNANPFAPLKVLFPKGHGKGALKRNMIILALVDCVIMSAAMGSGTVTILYVEYMFDWGTFESSRYVSFISFIRVVVLLGIFPLINHFFRIRPLQRRRRESDLQQVETNSGADEMDIWLLRIALFSDIAGIVGYIFARSSAGFVLFGVVTSFGGLGGAIIQSSITKHVPPERVGALLGGIGLLHALGRVVSPIMFNGIYAATVESFPQAFFILLASLFGLAFLGSLFVRPHIYMTNDDEVRDETIPAAVRTTVANEEEVLTEEEVASEPLPRL